MADFVTDYLWQFYDMEIRTVENGIQYITVDHYLSAKTDLQKDKNNVWQKLQRFMKRGKSEKTKVDYQQGDWFVDPRLQPHGRVQFSWNKTLAPFNGKGTPEKYTRFLHVVDFWLTYGCDGAYCPDMWHSIPTLQQFADRYMGVDCNGFVGGYFETNYPATGWDTSVSWTGGLKNGPKRKSAAEVKPLDVLVKYTDSDHKHVAIIEDVWSASGSKATVLVTQACDIKTGLRSDVCSLEITADGIAKVTGSYSGTFNEGVHGVKGANS